jgi:hypothetical protein
MERNCYRAQAMCSGLRASGRSHDDADAHLDADLVEQAARRFGDALRQAGQDALRGLD